MPSSVCLPLAASGPVNAMPKPMVIGWADCACAGAVKPVSANAPAAATASKLIFLDRSIDILPGGIRYLILRHIRRIRSPRARGQTDDGLPLLGRNFLPTLKLDLTSWRRRHPP